jgi:hypothetical protein
MNEAIKLAIEKGGYKTVSEEHWKQYGVKEFIILDPLFWQALGKALGWNETDKLAHDLHSPDIEPLWYLFAMEYFDLVLTGGDTEKFWKELLTR